jgi:hypothetical protein
MTKLNWRTNVIVKKARRHAFDVYRNLRPKIGKSVLVNSLPKSGTHLLINIISQLYDVVDSGNFIVSNTSFLGRRPGIEKNCTAIGKLFGSELAAAHLEFSNRYVETINSAAVSHFFIYRDPLAVFFSEYNYIKNMNRYHYLHRRLNSRNEEEAIQLLLNGGGSLVSAQERYESYVGWLDDPFTIAIRYEDLTGKRDELENKILDNCKLKRQTHFNRELAYERKYSHTATVPDVSHSLIRARHMRIVQDSLAETRIRFGYMK